MLQETGSYVGAKSGCIPAFTEQVTKILHKGSQLDWGSYRLLATMYNSFRPFEQKADHKHD